MLQKAIITNKILYTIFERSFYMKKNSFFTKIKIDVDSLYEITEAIRKKQDEKEKNKLKSKSNYNQDIPINIH